MVNQVAKPAPTRWVAWLLTLGGSIGLFASFVLTIDKFKFLANPNFVPSCSINPVISCGTIMNSSQAAAFGFPNPFIGLAAFSAVIVVGVSVLAGAKFPYWYWRLFNLGALFGVVFVHWLFFQSVYRIQALCPWCIVVWAVTIPIFWYTTLYNLSSGAIPTPKYLDGIVKFAQEYKNATLLIWYLVIAGLILQRFWYFFKAIV